jgi:hypothetical protein
MYAMEINDIPTFVEPAVRTFNCHYCKKLISFATAAEVIGFCNINCAENWKKEIPQRVIENQNTIIDN